MPASPINPAQKIADLEHRLAADPASQLFVPLAEAYRRAGRLEDAERILRRGVERHPGHHSARVGLGRVLSQRGSSQEAREVLTRVVQEVPDNLLAQRLLTELDDAAASAPVDETPVPSPTDELSGPTLADLYVAQGEPARGLEIYRELLEREPQNEEWAERIRSLEGSLLATDGKEPADTVEPPPPGAVALLSDGPTLSSPEPLPDELWEIDVDDAGGEGAGEGQPWIPGSATLPLMPGMTPFPAPEPPIAGESAEGNLDLAPAPGPSGAALRRERRLQALRQYLGRLQRQERDHVR